MAIKVDTLIQLLQGLDPQADVVLNSREYGDELYLMVGTHPILWSGPHFVTEIWSE